MSPGGPRVGGMLVGYYIACPRQAWLSLHGLWMEQESELVALGRLIDVTAYARERRPGQLEVTAPDGTSLVAQIDRLDPHEGIVHETKKSRSMEEAHVWQVRFYLWVLALAGVKGPDGQPLRGRIDYPALRQRVDVTLEPGHVTRLQEIVAAVRLLARQAHPPPRHPRRAFCRRCAYEELCYG